MFQIKDCLCTVHVEPGLRKETLLGSNTVLSLVNTSVLMHRKEVRIGLSPHRWHQVHAKVNCPHNSNQWKYLAHDPNKIPLWNSNPYSAQGQEFDPSLGAIREILYWWYWRIELRISRASRVLVIMGRVAMKPKIVGQQQVSHVRAQKANSSYPWQNKVYPRRRNGLKKTRRRLTV